MFKYKMLDSVKDQLWHLLKGLYEVIPQESLSVFDYQVTGVAALYFLCTGTVTTLYGCYAQALAQARA